MIRHVVMFRWKPETTADDVAAIEEGLSKLPGEIPEIHRYTFGADAGINEGNFDFVVVADFASTEDYRVYRDHPVHRAFIAERTAPNMAERSAIQFAID
jgi:hypothetical protein